MPVIRNRQSILAAILARFPGATIRGCGADVGSPEGLPRGSWTVHVHPNIAGDFSALLWAEWPGVYEGVGATPEAAIDVAVAQVGQGERERIAAAMERWAEEADDPWMSYCAGMVRKGDFS